jgi:hypothetical protein
MTEDQKRTIFESVIHSNCLKDNLEIMKDIVLDNGKRMDTGKLRIARNGFHVQLTHYLNSVYSKLDNFKFLNDSMEIDTKIMNSLSSLSLEEKEELLNNIKNEN